MVVNAASLIVDTTSVTKGLNADGKVIRVGAPAPHFAKSHDAGAAE
jgi:hypothetical protein